uniref:Uncharacterized protein n=1 Tax=Arundo donax TaxID=35708 RepID=A0A0A8YCE5_ARUDO
MDGILPNELGMFPLREFELRLR